MRKKPTILLQMIIGFSTILVLVIFVISYFSYHFSSQVVMNKTTQYLLESVIQMGGKIDRMLEEYDRLSLRIALHPATQEYLKSLNGQVSDHKPNIHDVQKVITQEQAYLRNDFLVQLVDNKGEMVFYQPSVKNFNIKKSDWYPFLNPRGGMFWTMNKIFYNTGQMQEGLIKGILGIREIKDYSSPSQGIGYMITVIPIEATESVIGNFLTSPSSKIQVIDSTGHIVYSTNPSEYGKSISRSFLRNLYKNTKGNTNIVVQQINGKEMYISSYKSNYSKWTIVVYIDTSKAINDLDTIKNFTIFIVIVGILASLLLVSFFSWSVSRPIRHLASRLSNIKRGDFEEYTGRMANWEVAVLYDSFNRMIRDLEETIRVLSYKQIREKQAQLIAMKAQFHPHFLYNSLNTIYFYAVRERQNKIAQMVLSLSEVLRYSIQPGTEFVTLRDDLEQLNRFIQLLRYRYEDKLQVEINVTEELLDYPVIKLLLQPLIENAISHGLEPVKRKKWIIRISISRKGNLIKFIIEDNGKGMNPEEIKNCLEFIEKLEEDLDVDDKPLHSGIGLRNLQHRIKLIYGNKYGLELSSSSLGGLKVQLEIPIPVDITNGSVKSSMKTPHRPSH